MVPQVGLEPHPEIPTAETIVLKFSKNKSKTSIDEGFERVRCLPQETQKSFQIADRQYKSSTNFLRRDAVLVAVQGIGMSPQPQGCVVYL